MAKFFSGSFNLPNARIHMEVSIGLYRAVSNTILSHTTEIFSRIYTAADEFKI